MGDSVLTSNYEYLFSSSLKYIFVLDFLSVVGGVGFAGAVNDQQIAFELMRERYG